MVEKKNCICKLLVYCTHVTYLHFGVCMYTLVFFFKYTTVISMLPPDVACKLEGPCQRHLGIDWRGGMVLAAPYWSSW